MKAYLEKSLNISSGNIIFYFLCLGFIILFFLLYIWPDTKLLADKDEKIKLLQSKIGTQKKIFPLYELLDHEKNQLDKYALSHPVNIQKNYQCDEEKIIIDLKTKIKANEFEIIHINSDANELSQNIKYFKLDLGIKGDFFKLRNFLEQVIRISCIEKIEQIIVKGGNKNKDIFLKLWVLQEKVKLAR